VLYDGQKPIFDIATDPYFTDIKALLPLEPTRRKRRSEWVVSTASVA
jgi:hypothetical protein